MISTGGLSDGIGGTVDIGGCFFVCATVSVSESLGLGLSSAPVRGQTLVRARGTVGDDHKHTSTSKRLGRRLRRVERVRTGGPVESGQCAVPPPGIGHTKWGLLGCWHYSVLTGPVAAKCGRADTTTIAAVAARDLPVLGPLRQLHLVGVDRGQNQ